MNSTDYSMDNDIIVESLSSYISIISEFREHIKNEEGLDSNNQHFYFRGQANSNWDVVPSVYRGNLLASEPDLIYSAYLRKPEEFRGLSNHFERLTKLQHSGLPTRLLDVTTNPLVALYFACQPYNEEVEDEDGSKKIETMDGAVFYKRSYGRNFQDIEIETIALLSSIKMHGDLTLDKCLDLLTESGVYSQIAAKECRKNEYKSLIKSLQNNYFVISTLNNERLIRQSGAFLLPGHYNIFIEANCIEKSIIQRGMGSLNAEFETTRFIIPSEKKEEILDELDIYSINEGTLFPELEHQMSYIKQQKLVISVPELGQFYRVQSMDGSADQEDNNKILYNIDEESLFLTVLSKHGLAQNYIQEALESLKSDLCIDWYQKESVLSSMRLHLTKIFASKPEFDRISAAEKAKEIINAILEEIRS